MSPAQIGAASLGGIAMLALLLAVGTVCFIKRRRRAQQRARHLSGRASDKIVAVDGDGDGGGHANGHAHAPALAEADASVAWGLVGWNAGNGNGGSSSSSEPNNKNAEIMAQQPRPARVSVQELAADERRRQQRASGLAGRAGDAQAPGQAERPLGAVGAALPAAHTPADPVEMSA